MSSFSRYLLLVFLTSVVAGCQTTSLERELSYNQKKLREIEEERDRLEFQLATSERQQQLTVKELVETQKTLADVSAKNAALSTENENLQARPTPAAAIIEDLSEPDLGSFKGIDGLTATSEDGDVRITVDQQVLFSSGSAEITRRGKVALDKLAAILRTEFSGRDIRVEGHTDSTPVKKTKMRWATNWELSSIRACAVLRSLLDADAAAPAKIEAVGYGSQRPVADNTTKEGRRQNRR
ncbi:MAG: OmpA family protein, partial [Planctomycetota bacterium]